MLKKLFRKIRPNPLDSIIKKATRKGDKKFLIAWNRGLGDIALGLFAMIQRIRESIPDASITFLTRENLQKGFLLLSNIQTIVVPYWERGKSYNALQTLRNLHIDPKEFDVIIENPDPTYWVKWQIAKVVPRLKWNEAWDGLYKKFDIPENGICIAVQPYAETDYGFWRNWPLEKWNELFSVIENQENVYILLLGYGSEPVFSHSCIIDLRGKTNLFEMLSIIKNRCSFLIVPDSGILSMTYYLDVPFPIHILSLWGDRSHGILKQRVSSPNPYLYHHPFIAKNRDLSTVQVSDILSVLFPKMESRK
ncbi:MAG: hypothetical protein WCP39_02470 [Chlamydiota bacterium]